MTNQECEGDAPDLMASTLGAMPLACARSGGRRKLWALPMDVDGCGTARFWPKGLWHRFHHQPANRLLHGRLRFALVLDREVVEAGPFERNVDRPESTEALERAHQIATQQVAGGEEVFDQTSVRG